MPFQKGNKLSSMGPNEIIIGTTSVHIKLTQGKWAIIDKSDYEKVRNYRWVVEYVHGIFYASADIGHRKRIRLHKILFPCVSGFQLDHIDGDGLNDKRCNLRYATHSQNMMNRRIQKNNKSNTPGVHWCNRDKKWIARIKINGNTIFLGSSFKKEKAIEYRKFGETKYFGEYRRKNVLAAR